MSALLYPVEFFIALCWYLFIVAFFALLDVIEWAERRWLWNFR